MKNCHRRLHIQINLDPKFQLQQANLIFGTKKKYTSAQKHKKINVTIEFFLFEVV